MLEVGALTTISYTKSDGETSNRKIIPVKLPTNLVLGLDATHMSPEEAERLVSLFNEYQNEYVKPHMSTMYKFEDWLAVTQDIIGPDVYWKSFVETGIVEL